MRTGLGDRAGIGLDDWESLEIQGNEGSIGMGRGRDYRFRTRDCDSFAATGRSRLRRQALPWK
jgi:hypothetical protein